jgi:60 kDa SS-A/Ro ribonucleoprotein
MDYTQHLDTMQPNQVQNNQGGISFAVDDFTRLDRFLILGTEGGSYYAGERALTQENAKSITACLALDSKRTIDRIVEISDAGRAPKNDPAIFALAMAASSPDNECRAYALSQMHKVCRIGTHLFQFAQACNSLRGWGKGLQKAVGRWYLDKKPSNLANQVLKYQQRNGWSHRDLLRLSHIQAHTGKASDEQNAIFRWIVSGTSQLGEREVIRKSTETKMKYPAVAALPDLLVKYDEMKVATDPKHIADLIREYNFTREMVPTQHLNDVGVWEALLERMPMTAMIRNLGKMTSIGLLKPFSNASKKVVAALDDQAVLKSARIHPISVLSAMKIYGRGHGEKGSLVWEPDQSIVDALDGAFYKAFDIIEPTNKNWLLALDVSSSMTWDRIAGLGFNPRDGSAAMSMATMKTEKNWHVVGFSDHLVPLRISPKQQLNDVLQTISLVPMGRTCCDLPMIYARENKLEVDVFVVYTDSETGSTSSPSQALQDYRQVMGRPAKMIVVGMVSNEFTIADPDDGGMMDVVGFDSSAPAIMTDFIRG